MQLRNIKYVHFYLAKNPNPIRITRRGGQMYFFKSSCFRVASEQWGVGPLCTILKKVFKKSFKAGRD
jgi:hypothetical protein